MTKRASLDTNLFKVELPPPPAKRDPLDTLIPVSEPIKTIQSNQTLPQPNQIEAKSERLNERTKEQRNERSNGQKNEMSPERFIIRHTFDIYQDQLVDLKRIQIEAMQRRRRKKKLGQMVQQALDLYIKNMKEKHSLQG